MSAFDFGNTYRRLVERERGGDRPVYTGLRDVVTQVVKNDGLLGFYRGIVPNFMKGIPVCLAVSSFS